MILIAYNENGKVVSILNSKSEDVARAYLHGKGVRYDSLRNLEDPEYFIPLDENPVGVYPLLETVEVIVNRFNITDKDTKYLCVK